MAVQSIHHGRPTEGLAFVWVDQLRLDRQHDYLQGKRLTLYEISTRAFSAARQSTSAGTMTQPRRPWRCKW